MDRKATPLIAPDGTQRITIIGVGRLGLCAALIFERKGYPVLGVEVFQEYADQLNTKTFYSHEPSVNEFLKSSTKFRVTTSLQEGVEFSDVIFIFVDTPTGVGEKSYDHSKLSKVLTQLNELKVQHKHIIISCTILPGYIENVGRYLLQDCSGTSLSYNPEFIAQGRIIEGFMNPDLVLIGEANKQVGDLLQSLYETITENEPKICRMSPESAEITKLAINCFITMKIAFCNMIGDIADCTPNANKFDVLRAVGSDSRIGSQYLTPGYGFGGPCFPRDNRALGNYARSLGIEPLLPTATDEANRQHTMFMIERFLQENRDVYEFESVTYKDNCPVPIIEESQKLVVARGLARRGKKVVIRDRQVVLREVMKEYGKLFQYEPIER